MRDATSIAGADGPLGPSDCLLNISGCAWLWVTLCLGALTGWPAAALAQVPDLEDYPAHELAQLPDAHRRWLEHDVLWLITSVERDVFLRLSDDASRDRFIEGFWQHRDPTPGTERNEYRDLHYERMKAARIFGRETSRPGYLTDRGMISILLGEPQSVSRYASTPVAVPIEVWHYAVDPALGVPAFFNLVFYRERGFGEHRLYSPLADGPEALLNPAGANEATTNAAHRLSSRGMRPTGFGDLQGVLDVLRTVDAELAEVSLSLVPGDPASIGISPLRSDALIGDVLSLPDRIMPAPSWAYALLAGEVDTEVRFATLPLEADAVVLTDPAGVMYLHYAARMPGARINLGAFRERHYATFEVTVGVRDDDLRFLVPAQERTIELELDAEAARRLRASELLHLGRIPLVDGRFAFDLSIENNVTHEYGRVEIEVTVPLPRPAVLTSSRPILVAEHESVGADAFSGAYPFQIGSHLMIPALSGPFQAGGTLWVFHQIQAPDHDVRMIDARYEIVDAGGAVRQSKTSRLDLANKDRFGVLSQLAGIKLEGLEPGSYTVRVDVDQDDQPSVDLTFRVVATEDRLEPLLHAQQYPPATDGQERLARARQLRTLGRTEAAIEMLETILQRTPGDSEALELQRRLLSDAGRHEDLVALLTPRVVQEPDNVELLVQLAEAQARQGNSYDAVRYYERARLAGVGDTPRILNALAAAYIDQGDLAQARALLEASLKLDPGQPGIQSLLQRLEPDSG